MVELCEWFQQILVSKHFLVQLIQEILCKETANAIKCRQVMKESRKSYRQFSGGHEREERIQSSQSGRAERTLHVAEQQQAHHFAVVLLVVPSVGQWNKHSRPDIQIKLQKSKNNRRINFDKNLGNVWIYQNLGLKGQKWSKCVPIRWQIDPIITNYQLYWNLDLKNAQFWQKMDFLSK